MMVKSYAEYTGLPLSPNQQTLPKFKKDYHTAFTNISRYRDIDTNYLSSQRFRIFIKTPEVHKKTEKGRKK